MRTLPAKTISHIIDPNIPLRISKKTILDLLPQKRLSIKEEFENIIWELLDDDDKDIHKFLVNKLWIGEKLIYDLEIERRMKPYIKEIQG